MANDESPLESEQIGSASTALLPVSLGEQHSGEWSSANALMQPAQSATPDLTIYLHAIRRHWLLALGVGLLCTALAGPGVWFGVGAKYMASSWLLVKMQDQPILSQNEVGGVDKDRFEIYKSTQQQQVLSRLVLLSALRKPEVSKLESVQIAQQEGDVVGWLTKQLSTSFPGRGEIMEVDAVRYDPKEAATLVRAVVDAYLNEVVLVEKNKKQERLNELDRACGEKETEIRLKREELKKWGETLGASDSDMLTHRQKLTLDELAMLRQQLAQTQFEWRKFKTELAANKALLKNIDTSEMSDIEMDMSVQSDPMARQLFMELGFKKMDQVYMENAAIGGAKSHYADRYQQDLRMLQQQYQVRRNELLDMVRQKKRSLVIADVQRLEASAGVMGGQVQELQAAVDAKLKEAERFGKSNVDVEMLRADIKNLDTLLGVIATERAKLRVEVRAAARVTLLQVAEIPDLPSNTRMRMAMAALAMCAGLIAPAIAIAFWDIRSKRINNCADVSKGLRLQVIGSVPLIPARVIRRLGSPAKRYQAWHLRLTESVDGIAARVLRKAEMEQCRVIMVSSATSGEGKTTLATQLALSLTRAGRRTVLVDFDLRRPAFDEVFGLPLSPGVCEALRQEHPVSELAHQVATNNLAVLTAGRWDRSALASLSNGAAAAMFKELRDEYDFVVVDTSPILPVADARFVSQHVDSVVLSVFRDISEAPKIQATCEILAAFGVHAVEAVVTGPNDNMYGKHAGYESTISA